MIDVGEVDQLLDYHKTYGCGDFGSPSHSIFEESFERIALKQVENCKDFVVVSESDAVNKHKVHMATAAALLEADFRVPCMDYHTLMKLTRVLTRENKSEVENMYRRMCFNIFAHNRDDHAKNFTFLYDEGEDRWHLSPAYDLTYSNTYYGEHTTSVDGNGKNPGGKEIVNVGMQAGMKKQNCLGIVEEIKAIVHQELGKYL